MSHLIDIELLTFSGAQYVEGPSGAMLEIQTIAVSSASTTIDGSLGNYVVLNMAASTTLDFDNLPGEGVRVFTLEINQDATGGRVLTIPSTWAARTTQPFIDDSEEARSFAQMLVKADGDITFLEGAVGIRLPA